jgi:predicted XRE-type DNA-binding protein
MRNGSRLKPKRAAGGPDGPARVEAGSGNVFADIGLPNPDLALMKADLVQRIRMLIADRHLTQAQAAALFGLGQPKISGLVRGRVEGYSLDRLLRFLTALGQRVEITVRPNAAAMGRTKRRMVVVP